VDVELAERCRTLDEENSYLRAALSASTWAEQAPDVAPRPQDSEGASGFRWEEAYWDLRAELESLRRDNDALVREVQGRKRSQYGSRSERIRPEELLVGMRELKKMHPQQVPAGMLEDLERECAEREATRQRRKAKREEKRRATVDAAALRAIKQLDPHRDDGGDDDGGGGGSNRAPRASKDVEPPGGQVIPLRRTGNRNACLSALPPHDDIIAVAESDRYCPVCNKERGVIGYQDSHMLDIELPKLRHLRMRQEKRACTHHAETGVAVAPARERPIAQGLPTAMLLAFVVVAKAQDHLPLERLSGILRRWGARVSPSTLGGWFHAAGDLVAPLAEHLGRAILRSAACMHTDGTNIRVIDPTAERGSTRGSLWGYTVDDVGAYFVYTPDGSFDDTRAALGKRPGPTMTDGHKAYVSQRVEGTKQAVPVIHGPHLNCLDHARRPFEEAFRLDGDPRATVILRCIQDLYSVERSAKSQSLSPDQVLALREAKSRPIFDLLFCELENLKAVATPKSRLGRAAATMLNRKSHLAAYLSNGAWPISNALQETQFRSKALGQHNWLFIGSHDAAPRYAAILTLVRTCAMLDIEPTAYLADIFMRLQERGSAKHLDDLLPAAWKHAQRSVRQRSVAA
jgi:transposase